MTQGQKKPMEILELILVEVKHVRDEQKEIRRRLDDHVEGQNEDFKEVRDDIAKLSTKTALNRNDTNKISAGISAVVSAGIAGIVSWLALKFGGGA